ncbi:hypothetical protein GGR58DRAFT_505388 [Xylaria digitata]|nr:hypothetical protein GGR58DRAFT_505388 [Xylaria digitata]
MFEEYVTEILKATQELRLKLGIEEGSRVSSSDQASILETLKRNTSFTLKRKEYEGVLSKMKTNNAALQDLCRVHLELEPHRGRRSQLRVTALLRGLSHSIYSALCNTITCKCIYPHIIGLQLARRDAVMLPNDVEEEVAQQFDFNIALRTTIAKDTKKFAQPPTRQSSSGGISLKELPTAACRCTERFHRPKYLTYVILLRGSLKLQLWAIMTVLHTQRKFVLSPPNEVGPQKYITLRQVLDGSTLDLPPFGLKDQLQLALALSVSIIHLSGTPWLAQIMTLDDIVLLVGDGNTTSQPTLSIYQPFVIQCVHRTAALQGGSSLTTDPQMASSTRDFGQARPINYATLSLGALLIQIAIRRVDSELEMTYTLDTRSIASKRESCSRLEE